MGQKQLLSQRRIIISRIKNQPAVIVLTTAGLFF